MREKLSLGHRGQNHWDAALSCHPPPFCLLCCVLLCARRVATNVQEKRYCRTTLQDMGTALGRPVYNNVQLHGTKEAALAAGRAMNDTIVKSAAKRLVKYSLYTHLKFLNPSSWPPPDSKEWGSFGHTSLEDLCTEWADFLTQEHQWVDPHQGVETEWKEVKAFIIEKGLLKKGASVFEFWRPIIQQPILFPHLHVILRCALAVSPTSCDVERLLSLLNPHQFP